MSRLIATSILCILATLSAIQASVAESYPVPVSRVGFVRGDAQPTTGACTEWDPKESTAWDYGNRSLVIELPQAQRVTGIIVTSDIKTGHEIKFTPQTLSVYTSADNDIYTRYEGPVTIDIAPVKQGDGVWRVRFLDLALTARYIKLKQTYDSDENGFESSNLKEAVQVFSDVAPGEPVSVDGLYVSPAQETGNLAAYLLVSGPERPDLRVQLEAQNTETFETVSETSPVRPGAWTRVTLISPKLTQGPYWLTARLMLGDSPAAERKSAFHIHTSVLTDSRRTIPEPPPGGAVILADLPRWCEGGAAFDYTLPHRPGVPFHGVVIPKGGQISLRSPVGGECAAYVAVENPWPELTVKWRDTSSTIPQTQGDWPVKGGVQEVFVGFGDFSEAPLVVGCAGGPLRVTHLRLARLTPEETELAHHVNDPTHNRRVIYNNDGYSELWGVKDWDKARLLELINRYEGTDTEMFDMNCFVSGTVSYPSKYATFWKVGEIPDDQWVRANDKMAFELYNQLEDDGIPIYPTLVARGRELGIPVWGALRMSAYYGFQEQQTMQPFNGKLWHEHPEMRIRDRDGSQRVEMSYAWEAVRNERLGVLRELLEMGCDGIEMDFCRYPYILGYDEPLIEGFKAKYGVSPLDLPEEDERWVSYRCEVMNDFFRAVRRQTDEIAAQTGRKLGISVRIPATGYKVYGFDPETWAQEGLMDIFIPHYPGLQRDFDMKPWADMVRGTGIKLYPGIEVTKSEVGVTEPTDAEVARGVTGYAIAMSADDYRRLVWRRYRQGADGVYLFNIWTVGYTRNLLGDKQSLSKWSYFEDPMNQPRVDIAF